MLAGCGGASGHGTQEVGAATQGLGKRVYARSCDGCHSLTGHETSTDGGDLALDSLTLAQMESFTRVMPTRPLTPSQVRAVSIYVLTRTRRIRAASG